MGLLSRQKSRGTSAVAEQSAAAQPSGGSGRKRLFEGRDGARAQQRSHLCAAENSSRLLSRRWPRLPNLAAQRAIGFTWHTQPARRGRGRESCREQSKSSPKSAVFPVARSKHIAFEPFETVDRRVAGDSVPKRRFSQTLKRKNEKYIVGFNL